MKKENIFSNAVLFVLAVLALLTWKGVISFSKDGKAGERIVKKFDQTNFKQEAYEWTTSHRGTLIEGGENVLEAERWYWIEIPPGHYVWWDKPDQIKLDVYDPVLNRTYEQWAQHIDIQWDQSRRWLSFRAKERMNLVVLLKKR
jgi:hypothetical protein